MQFDRMVLYHIFVCIVCCKTHPASLLLHDRMTESLAARLAGWLIGRLDGRLTD
jgi:hypothetical protein